MDGFISIDKHRPDIGLQKVRVCLLEGFVTNAGWKQRRACVRVCVVDNHTERPELVLVQHSGLLL